MNEWLGYKFIIFYWLNRVVEFNRMEIRIFLFWEIMFNIKNYCLNLTTNQTKFLLLGMSFKQ